MDHRPGVKTTEFYLSALAAVLGALQVAGVFGDESMAGKIIGAVVLALAALGYTAARAKIKAAAGPSAPKPEPPAEPPAEENP